MLRDLSRILTQRLSGVLDPIHEGHTQDTDSVSAPAIVEGDSAPAKGDHNSARIRKEDANPREQRIFHGLTFY